MISILDLSHVDQVERIKTNFFRLIYINS